MTTRLVRTCCAAALACAVARAAAAQSPGADSADARADNMWHASARMGSLAFGVPQQFSASVLLGMERYWGAGTRRFTQMWYVRLEPGLAASRVALGVGAWQLADQGGGATVQVAALRTYGSPWSAPKDQTYWGVEARAYVWLVGPYVGYFQQVDGRGTRDAFVSAGIAIGF